MGRRVQAAWHAPTLALHRRHHHRWPRSRSGDRRIRTFQGGRTVPENEYGRAIDVLQALEGRVAAAYALLGKAFFMDGNTNRPSLIWRKPSARIASIPNTMTGSAGRTDDWLRDRAFCRHSAMPGRRCALFERAVELDPSNWKH
jgi:hypothetical protein